MSRIQRSALAVAFLLGLAVGASAQQLEDHPPKPVEPTPLDEPHEEPPALTLEPPQQPEESGETGESFESMVPS